MGESEASQAWREDLAVRFAGLSASATEFEDEPAGRIQSVGVSDVGVHEVTGTSQTLERCAVDVRRTPSETLKVCLMVDGSGIVEQAGHEMAIGAGQFVLYDTGRPYRLTLQASDDCPWRVSVMTVPRRSLSLPPSAIAPALQRPFAADARAGLVFASFLRSVAMLEAAPHEGVRDAGIALLSGALRESLGPALETCSQAVRAEVHRYIKHHLDDLDLSTEKVAAAQHLSVRTVQRLLAADGSSVTRLVREGRLDAIRRDLTDPLLAARNIGALAARWGITDQPWLSRAFRAAYSMSPSQYRREALSGNRSEIA